MAVEQIGAVIDHIRDCHEQVAEYFHRLADGAQRTRVRLLLDYMSAHEERLADALADYEDAAPAKILNTWLTSDTEIAGLTEVKDCLRQAHVDAAIDVEKLIELGLKLSDCLLNVYRDLAERGEPESIRQVFENLLHMEEKAQRQFARDAGRMSDL